MNLNSIRRIARRSRSRSVTRLLTDSGLIPVFAFSCLAACLVPSSADAQEFGAEFVQVHSNGCSQSWAEDETTVQVALLLDGNLATLSLDVMRRGRGGSHFDPRSGNWSGMDNAQCEWSGRASVDSDGQWTVQFAELESTPDNASACSVGAGDPSFVLVCAPEFVAEGTSVLSDRQDVPSAPAGAQALEVLRCESSDHLPESMLDATNAGPTSTSPRSFYVAETASMTVNVNISRGYVLERTVSVVAP